MILYVPFYRSTAAIFPVVVNTDLVALAVMVVPADAAPYKGMKPMFDLVW
jgi:hypothetical protein